MAKPKTKPKGSIIPGAGEKCVECQGPMVPCAYAKCPQRSLSQTSQTSQATPLERFFGGGLAAQRAVDKLVKPNGR